MKTSLLKKWWFWPLVFGLILRLIVMPITLHPDLWGQSIASYFFAYEGKLNIYDYLLNLPHDNPLSQNFSVRFLYIYPPMMYFTQGLLMFLGRPFADSSFIPFLIGNVSNIYSYKGLMSQLFWLKLPYLFLDISLAFVLANIFNDANKKKIAFTLWMFNPVAIYTSFMMGQNDILPVFFSVLALYFAFKDKKNIAMLAFGLAASYKVYALLFIIPSGLVIGRDFKDKLRYCILGFLPYLLSVGPFLLSPGYRELVLLNPESQKMLFMKLNVSGAEGVYPFILGLVLIYFHAYYKGRLILLGYYILAILLLLFSVTHFHPQWFLWVTPLLNWEAVTGKLKYWPILATLFFCWLFITLFFEPSLSYGLFHPIIPALKETVGLSEIIGKYYDVNLIKSIIRSVFAGASVYYIINLFNSVPKKGSEQ